MASLNKIHKEIIDKMIKDNEKIRFIKSYCIGAGIDTNSYSSGVFIDEEKIVITYRRKNYYHNIIN